MNEGMIRDRQLKGLLFLSLLFDALISMWNTAELPSAKNMLLVIAVGSAGLWLLLRPLSRWYRRGIEGAGLLEETPLKARWLVRISGAAVFLFFAAESALRTVTFYLSVEQQKSSQVLFLLLFCASAAYGVYLGTEAVARGGAVILVLGLVSFGAVLAANLGNARLENLDVAAVQLEQCIAFSLWHPLPCAPFAAALVLAGRVTGKRAGFGRLCLWQMLLLLALLVVGELSLGGFLKASGMPVLYLSQIGSLSIFERFDAVYGALFVLCGFAKCTLYLSCVWQLLAPGLKKQDRPFWLGVLAGAVFFCAMALMLLRMLWLYLAVQLLGTLILAGAPATLALCKRRRRS